jgi:hypothetical protein
MDLATVLKKSGDDLARFSQGQTAVARLQLQDYGESPKTGLSQSFRELNWGWSKAIHRSIGGKNQPHTEKDIEISYKLWNRFVSLRTAYILFLAKRLSW